MAHAPTLLHKLNGCDQDEHFCLHIKNDSELTMRSCISVTRAGDGNIDCWGATDERNSACIDTVGNIGDYLYRCSGKNIVCMSILNICNGIVDCPLGDDEQLCPWLPSPADSQYFYCRNGTHMLREVVQCNHRLDCADGEDAWFCELKARRLMPKTGYLPAYPLDLHYNRVSLQSVQALLPDSSFLVSDWYCNRGMPVYDRLLRRCLCPPSYSGENCENQRARIVVLLKLDTSASLRREIAIKIVIYLIDLASREILIDDEILHLPYVHSLYKHLAMLPSPGANHSFVRIDTYELSTDAVLSHRMSWKFTLPFSFLPVRRLAIKLVLPFFGHSITREQSTCTSCIHGLCLAYENSPDSFCLCYNGWTGIYCNTSLTCALGARSLSSNRCLCPTNRYGTHCFVPYTIECQCQNGATCIPLDARARQVACLCSDNFFGTYCEYKHANLTIVNFDMQQPDILPIVLIQFIEITKEYNIVFENTFLFERLSAHRPFSVRHVGHKMLPTMVLAKIFYSTSIHHYAYYLLYLSLTSETNIVPSTNVRTRLEASYRCSHVRDLLIFKSPINILAYDYTKRIKFYLRACADNITHCFHDETYLCFCPEDRSTTGNCLIYDHNSHICQKPNYCLNNGLCLENRRNGIVEFVCLCPSCYYYGALCQFSLGQQGLSLDALLSAEVSTGKPFSDQSVLIKVCTALLTAMIFIGFVSNTLCTMVFAEAKSRKNGCGYYLLAMSLVNQLGLIVLILRFVYLIATQTTVWKDRARSLAICQCLEFGLTTLPNLSSWLSACVSVERLLTVARGAAFDKSGSERTAKILCIGFTLIMAGTSAHVFIIHHLIDDPRLGQFTWCIVKFDSVKMQTYASVFSIMHLISPFLINLISTGFLIVHITAQKLRLHQHDSFLVVLRQQIAHYKHLIISPIVLVILTLPRLIISLASLCIDTSWFNYLFLSGYFVSFVPLSTTLLIFIWPSPIYKSALKKRLSHIRGLFISN